VKSFGDSSQMENTVGVALTENGLLEIYDLPCILLRNICMDHQDYKLSRYWNYHLSGNHQNVTPWKDHNHKHRLK
jgi:hypothetical protein